MQDQYTNIVKMTNYPFTTSNGAPVKIPDQSQRIGNQHRGTNLIQDIHLLELIQHVTKERVPERLVHARGSGAHGFFEVTDPWIADVTSAAFLTQVGKKTPLFFRGSTTGGASGSAETVRDTRGFGFKLYTEEGNLDWAFLSTPIFSIRDGIKFPSLIHATKKNPRTNLPDANMFWDFFTNNPESAHFLSMLFTDRATPKAYQNSDIWSINTYRFTKNDGSFVYCRITMKPVLGIATFDAHQAQEKAGADAEFHSRELFEAIEKAQSNPDEFPFPEWEVFAQIVTPEDLLTLSVNIFDATKTIPQSEVPLQKFGKVVLNKNPDNFFAEVEQAAFSPTNVVPGWALSPDPILQTRALAYPDTQRYRIGVNFAQLPVNKPTTKVFNPLMRDGFCTTENLGSTPNYYPSSFLTIGTAPQFPQPDQEFYQGTVVQFALPITDEDFAQPRNFVENVLTPQEQDALVLNVAKSLADASIESVRTRAIEEIWKRISQFIGNRIADETARELIRREQGMNISKLASLDIQPPKKNRRVFSAHNEGIFSHLPHVESRAAAGTRKLTGNNGIKATNGTNGVRH
ncbi:hypothetical protein MKZ38_008347 [Zalerion maritima]|uniref:Catalase core domain-containing protein n=1 Tax=Zalerion maritima TaxID=339359 RepID=A0AAD5RVD1_9PEZI|nr:hypothetical protein MKZ38_008347 [Zalerion maritima]